MKKIVLASLVLMTTSAYCAFTPGLDGNPMPAPAPAPIIIPAVGAHLNEPKITLSDAGRGIIILQALNDVRTGKRPLSDTPQYLADQLYPRPKPVAPKETSQERKALSYTEKATIASAVLTTAAAGYIGYSALTGEGASGLVMLPVLCLDVALLGAGAAADGLKYAYNNRSAISNGAKRAATTASDN